jgi:hypothetical protein
MQNHNVWVPIIVLSLAPVCVLLSLWWGKQIKAKLRRRVVSFARPVEMPPRYVKREPRKLSEVPADQVAFVDFMDVTVDRKGRTFVDLDARVYEKPTYSSVRVLVTKDGCSLTLPKRPSSPMTFTPRRLYSFTAYLPVTRIVEEEGES